MGGKQNMIGWCTGKESLKDAVLSHSPFDAPLFGAFFYGFHFIFLVFEVDSGFCLAVAYPYLFAFEPSFIEIHSLETGALAQIIPGSNIRLLADGRGKLGEGGEILFACENSLSGAAGGMDGQCQVNALIKTGQNFTTSPRIRHIEE
jgi:hypothetical protein